MDATYHRYTFLVIHCFVHRNYNPMWSYWHLMHIHYFFFKYDLSGAHNMSSLVKRSMGLHYDMPTSNACILFSASISHGGICITSHYFLVYTTIHFLDISIHGMLNSWTYSFQWEWKTITLIFLKYIIHPYTIKSHI